MKYAFLRKPALFVLPVAVLLMLALSANSRAASTLPAERPQVLDAFISQSNMLSGDERYSYTLIPADD